MAVATQAQLSLPARTWDEEIVPALRKRLKEESAALAKRMSGQSLRSSEEGQQNMSAAASAITAYANNAKAVSLRANGTASEDSGYFDSVYLQADHTTVAPSSSARPSGIPRPSFSTSTSEGVRAGNGGSTPNTPRSHKNRSRARTISTPQPFDNEGFSDESGNMPAQHHRPQFQSSRSNSPMPGLANGQLYRSRIPRPSTQQSHHTPPLPFTPDPDTTPQLEKIAWPTSYAAMSSTPDLLREPKGPNSEMATPRESMDEEGEYEHWYRGDVSRSGGVGELKVAKRREMLDIANYGHLNPGPRSIVSSRPGSIIDSSFPNRVTRKRAGSLTERGSVYIEDESVTEWVIDELPLTDDDSATFPDPSDPYSGIGVARSSTKSPAFAGRKPIQISPDLVTDTKSPAPAVRSFTAPVPLAHKQTQPQYLQPPSQSQNVKSLANGVKGGQNQNQAQKRVRVISKPTQNKKPKAQTINAINRGKTALNVDEKSERPVSGLMMDAIPSWSVPVAKDGNWDNVVLPVVARKMGLEEQFEEVDGANPPKKPPAESMIQPAPGTFGYDYSKYRPPRNDTNVEALPIGEFGTVVPSIHPPSPQPRPTSTTRPRPPSPGPFADYTQITSTINNARDTQMIRLHNGQNQTPPILLHPPTMNSMIEEKRKMVEGKEEEGAGCCKCVVM